jgi:hypothetical protein
MIGRLTALARSTILVAQALLAAISYGIAERLVGAAAGRVQTLHALS